jgi:hypothetical protein
MFRVTTENMAIHLRDMTRARRRSPMSSGSMISINSGSSPRFYTQRQPRSLLRSSLRFDPASKARGSFASLKLARYSFAP